MKVKIFSTYNNVAVPTNEKLDDKINNFLYENTGMIECKDIKFSSSFAIASNGAKFIAESAMIMYEKL